MKKILILIAFLVLMGIFLYSIEMGKSLYGFMWGLHYAAYNNDGSISPYRLYKNFYFKNDFSIRNRKNLKIGTWYLCPNGFMVFIGDEGLYGGIVFIPESTIMGGSGEINKSPWYIKIQIIRLYRIKKITAEKPPGQNSGD